MPCAKKSPTLSSALTAATVAFSSFYSASTPVATSSSVETSISVANSSVVTASASSMTGDATALFTRSLNSALANRNSKTSYAGVSIAGLDFGCSEDGTCTAGGVTVPRNGAEQMKHFVSADGLDTLRLPVGWQYLTNHVVGGDLDPANFGEYDKLVQSCLSTGSKCIVDVHNYVSQDLYRLPIDVMEKLRGPVPWALADLQGYRRAGTAVSLARVALRIMSSLRCGRLSQPSTKTIWMLSLAS